MANIKITDVRSLPGDSSFLVDDGKTSILYDTGFAFTGNKVAENIKKELLSRQLDYIFLTHSHYDHALGSVYIKRAFLNAKIIAGEYAAKIFARPTARATMRELDRKFADKNGVFGYEDLIDELSCDITVNDGDKIHCGDMTYTAISLPGHTKCSFGYYLEKEKLLLGSETLGVYFGNGVYMPSYLVGYNITLESFKKAKSLDIKKMLIPHYGVIEGDEVKEYLEGSYEASVYTAKKIKEMLLLGNSKEDILEWFKNELYTDIIAPSYPIDAFLLNTSIMIALVEKECV